MRVALLVPAAFAVLACDEAKDAHVPQPPQQDWRALLGDQQFTIAGRIKDVRGPRSFTVETFDDVFSKAPVSVVTELPVRFGGEPLQRADFVVVTGIVRARDRKPTVIAAETIRRLAEYEQWSVDPAKRSISVLAILNAADAVSLVDDHVRYDTALVQRVGPTAVWVGPNLRNTVIVVPADIETLKGVRKGMRVEIEGTIRQMPTLPRARDVLGLDGEITDAELAREHVYIHATKLAVAASPSS